MDLLDVVRRQPAPKPWAEGEKIPWNDPEFSARMLQEHLSQVHDAASRRLETVEKHVGWIHHSLLAGKPSRILDLACGPGLYASRFCALGHVCVGIDFSPASIAYAREQAQQAGLRCTYIQEDIRQADYGTGYNLAMFIFGEFNVFRPADARRILSKAHRALAPGSLLLLEPHTFDAVQKEGEQTPSWHTAERGLFADRPHFVLHEALWDAVQHVTTERYYIIDAATGAVTAHASSMQAYTDQEYAALLVEAGFEDVQFYPSLTGEEDASQKSLLAIVARKG